MDFANVLVRQVKHDIHQELLDYTMNLIQRCLCLKVLHTLGASVNLVLAFIMLFEVINIVSPDEVMHTRVEVLRLSQMSQSI